MGYISYFLKTKTTFKCTGVELPCHGVASQWSESKSGGFSFQAVLVDPLLILVRMTIKGALVIVVKCVRLASHILQEISVISFLQVRGKITNK